MEQAKTLYEKDPSQWRVYSSPDQTTLYYNLATGTTTDSFPKEITATNIRIKEMNTEELAAFQRSLDASMTPSVTETSTDNVSDDTISAWFQPGTAQRYSIGSLEELQEALNWEKRTTASRGNECGEVFYVNCITGESNWNAPHVCELLETPYKGIELEEISPPTVVRAVAKVYTVAERLITSNIPGDITCLLEDLEMLVFSLCHYQDETEWTQSLQADMQQCIMLCVNPKMPPLIHFYTAMCICCLGEQQSIIMRELLQEPSARINLWIMSAAILAEELLEMTRISNFKQSFPKLGSTIEYPWDNVENLKPPSIDHIGVWQQYTTSLVASIGSRKPEPRLLYPEIGIVLSALSASQHTPDVLCCICNVLVHMLDYITTEVRHHAEYSGLINAFKQDPRTPICIDCVIGLLNECGTQDFEQAQQAVKLLTCLLQEFPSIFLASSKTLLLEIVLRLLENTAPIDVDNFETESEQHMYHLLSILLVNICRARDPSVLKDQEDRLREWMQQARVAGVLDDDEYTLVSSALE